MVSNCFNRIPTSHKFQHDRRTRLESSSCGKREPESEFDI